MLQRLFIALFLFLAITAGATHIVGGEMYYDCLGNDQYRVTMKIYRDCGPANTNGTGFDNPAPVAVYRNGILFQTVNPTIGGIVNVPIVINDPCLSAPPNICVEQATYTFTVNLPPDPSGYDIVYQRCCHNPNILNVLNPQDAGSSFISHIPGSGLGICNSSPRFNSLPPLVMCNNSDFVFDHSATDPDGDQLSYAFYTPFLGGDPFAPLPNPPLPPPFGNITWQGGFSQNNQITGNPAFTVNSSSGLLTGTSTMNGLYLYGVVVTEKRNGQIISQSYREFQVTVTNCPSLVVSAIPVQTQLCQGTTLNIGNNSQNSTFYHWDFGVPGINSDTSNLMNPSYVYPDTGTFTITLVANPGYWCADTATQEYEVHYPLDLTLSSVNPQCIDVNSFDFDLNGNFDGNATINWTFGANANPSSSTIADPQNIVYSDSGHYVAQVTVSEFGCTESVQTPVTVFPLPQFSFTYPPEDGCAPYAVQFNNTSFAWGTISTVWNFGDGTNSVLPNPTHIYNNPGSYDLSVTISVDSICVNTQTFSIPDAIVVHPRPSAGITADPPSASIWYANFTAFDQSSGAITQTMYFDNGASATDSSQAGTTFLTSGEHVIWQIATNEFGCTDSAATTIFVEGMTTIFAPNAFSPNGDGKNEMWKPQVFDVTNYELIIYDRWGQPIFVTTNTQDGWDGTRNNGRWCPQDVYVYQITYRDWEDIDRVVRGHFTLIR